MTADPPSSSPTGSGLSITAAGLSDPGRARPENEDAFGEFPRTRLYVVADGMGGRAAGHVAADLTVREVERFFREQQAAPRTPWPYPIDRARSFGSNLLAVAFKVANQAIRQAAAANPEHHRMGATAAALAVGETQVVVGHVGDVRVYRLRSGQLTALTRDHSIVEEVRAARPQMSEEELAGIANRNVVTRALGTRAEVEATVTTSALAPGDLYLLCSDGLWGLLDEPSLLAMLTAQRELDTTAQRLIDAANQAGGHDNITALLVRIEPS